MTNEQIKYMVQRFLTWKLPENFSPDGGISFKPTYNENTTHPARHEPQGTNLLDYTQAEAMVRHMLEGLPGVVVAEMKLTVDASQVQEVIRAELVKLETRGS